MKTTVPAFLWDGNRRFDPAAPDSLRRVSEVSSRRQLQIATSWCKKPSREARSASFGRVCGEVYKILTVRILKASLQWRAAGGRKCANPWIGAKNWGCAGPHSGRLRHSGLLPSRQCISALLGPASDRCEMPRDVGDKPIAIPGVSKKGRRPARDSNPRSLAPNESAGQVWRPGWLQQQFDCSQPCGGLWQVACHILPACRAALRGEAEGGLKLSGIS